MNHLPYYGKQKSGDEDVSTSPPLPERWSYVHGSLLSGAHYPKPLQSYAFFLYIQ